MAKRKKVVKKVVGRPRTTAKSRSSGDTPWKKAERAVCRYFGTERAAMGQKGHDSREVPIINNWLRDKAPELMIERFSSGTELGVDRFTHVFVESKCHKSLLTLLERWNDVVRGNPDRKTLLPLMLMGEIGDSGPPSKLIGFCRLEDFPKVYRGFVAPPIVDPTIWLANLFNRFWTVRYTLDPTLVVMDALKQSEQDAATWREKQTALPGVIMPLSVVYLSYPKHLTPALVFRLPSFAS